MMRACSPSALDVGVPFSKVSARSSTGADCSCAPFTGISFCSSDIVYEPPTQNYAVYAMLSGLTFYVLRFTFHILRFTFYVSHFTFHVLRFTFYVSRFTFYIYRFPSPPYSAPSRSLITVEI